MEPMFCANYAAIARQAGPEPLKLANNSSPGI